MDFDPTTEEGQVDINDNLERELGLTTKEKIKRALLKYSVPLAFAVGIASAVGCNNQHVERHWQRGKKGRRGIGKSRKEDGSCPSWAIGVRAFLGVKNRRGAAEVPWQQHLDIGC